MWRIWKQVFLGVMCAVVDEEDLQIYEKVLQEKKIKTIKRYFFIFEFSSAADTSITWWNIWKAI